MAESKRICFCGECLDEFCRNCSNAEYPDDFCSRECEDKHYGNTLEAPEGE